MDKRRQKRIAALIRSELGRLLVQEVSEPELQSIAVTEVTVTRDLKHARVYFEGGGSDAKALQEGLRRARPFLRRRLGEALGLRQVPDLNFERDEHGESLYRLMKLIEEANGPSNSGVG